MVPVRFVSEAWGTTVLWDDDHRTVVLADTAGLIAEMDQNFTVFNKILQAQQQTFAGKKLVQSMQATGQLTLYDEAGKATDYAVSAEAKTYSDGKAQRMQATLNMESALKALAKTHPEILDQVQVSLGTLLRTDLKRIPVDFLVDETGGCYLSTPCSTCSSPSSLWKPAGSTSRTWTPPFSPWPRRAAASARSSPRVSPASAPLTITTR